MKFTNKLLIILITLITFTSCEKETIPWSGAYLIDIDLDNPDQLIVTDITTYSAAAEGGFPEKNGSGDYKASFESIAEDDEYILITFEVEPRPLRSVDFLQGTMRQDSRPLPTDTYIFQVEALKSKPIIFRVTYH